MAQSGISITNFKQVTAHLEKLDLTNKENLKATRKVLKKPFLDMRRISRQNLLGQNSKRTGNLARGLSVGSRFSKVKGYLTVAFGARTKAVNANKPKRRGKKAGSKMRGSLNHFHLVNSGTKKRYHRNFKSVGAVGKGRSSGHPLMNPSFRVGFADKAIKSILPSIKGRYVQDLGAILSKIKTAGV